MRQALLVAFFLISAVAPVSAATLDELTPYLSGQFMTWQEHEGGRRILRESGGLLAGGVAVGMTGREVIDLRGKAELFLGITRYRGETQGQSPTPVTTDVYYLGARAELDLGPKVIFAQGYLEPFAGLGCRYWLRDLQDTVTRETRVVGGTTIPAGDKVSGYTEFWQTGYARFGARGGYRISPKDSFFWEGGATYPFYIGNSVDFAGSGWTTFRPRGNWSGFGETGFTNGALKVALSYEGFSCSRSPVVPVGSSFFLQPDSSSAIYSLRVGWSFR